MSDFNSSLKPLLLIILNIIKEDIKEKEFIKISLINILIDFKSFNFRRIIIINKSDF